MTEEDEAGDAIRLSVLGDYFVGKSALAARLRRDIFVPEWEPSMEENYRKPVEVDNICCQVELLDTMPSAAFYALRPQWMLCKDGYIFMFDLHREGSQNELEQYYELHSQLKEGSTYEDPHNPIVMLVGNKKDLVDEDPSKRTMTEDEGKALAAKWGAEYIEISCRTGHNVNELFERIVRQVRVLRSQPMQKTARQWCRIFSTPERFLKRVSGPEKMLVDFFIGRPGLRRLIGGLLARYYNPCNAAPLESQKKCVVM